MVSGDAAAVCNGLMHCPEMLLQELDWAWSAVGRALSRASSGTPFSVIMTSGDPYDRRILVSVS